MKSDPIKTISEWKAAKRIITDWEEKQALNFLEPNEISCDIKTERSLTRRTKKTLACHAQRYRRLNDAAIIHNQVKF